MLRRQETTIHHDLGNSFVFTLVRLAKLLEPTLSIIYLRNLVSFHK
uniref:Uncharacterized protein n=1 Tax=Schistosoma japonicum TaxID=6182 RepID=Q5C1X4_SCHJA|nr:unknown [Schistosoma japonicum]